MFGMPDIPNWKGIPNATFDAGISFGGAALINKLFGNYWGVFNQYGVPLLLADNVISLQYQNQNRVVSAPIEKGSFASYNKVADPWKATVQLSKGSGGTFERGAFLAQLEVLSKSTLKFIIITPEFVYKFANITGYDLAREAKDGATLIKVNVHLEEIREVTVKYDEEEVKQPEDAKIKDGGDKTQSAENDSFDTSLKELADIFNDPDKSYLVKGSEAAQLVIKVMGNMYKDIQQVKDAVGMMEMQVGGGF
ncbi:phage baseplate protein [Providencia sp. PROV075]|uniref:phage baseplate protein n=1 Tax=Providencia sp. PROV075 TaxID=2949797 RepID=UPI00234B63E8